MTNKSSQNSMVLSDGRVLGFEEYGSPSGKPVFYFHTHPGSRIGGRFMDQAANRNNIRIISPDRPGSGLSDFKPDRTLLDWPQDVSELADHLGIEEFAVLGVSGGGPYAAVCTYKLPQRVTRAGLLASIGPIDVQGLTKGMQMSNRIMFRMAKFFPKLIPYLLAGTARGLESPEKLIDQLRKTMPKVDVKAMDNQNLWPWFTEDLQEAFREGLAGPSHDVFLYVQPWGFPLEEIQVPVLLWQGEEDTNAPLAMGQYLAEKIPNCQEMFIPKMAHLSVIIEKAEEALKLLVE